MTETSETDHHLVQHTASSIRHLIELVNAAHTAVTEDQSTTLQDELLGIRISGHVSRETDCR